MLLTRILTAVVLVVFLAVVLLALPATLALGALGVMTLAGAWEWSALDDEMTKKIITTARSLRKSFTDAENLLWGHLRRKQLAGLKFRRQQPVDKFLVDFVCFEKRIIIEVDGGQHSIEREKDFQRDNYLIKNGFKVLRFWNNEVLKNVEGVLEEIMKYC